jgi:diketogulonate reductase-like aldo/keto reductase
MYYSPITKLPGGPLDDVIERIARQLGPKVTPAQVLMSWIRAKGVVVVTYVLSLTLVVITLADTTEVQHPARNVSKNI